MPFITHHYFICVHVLVVFLFISGCTVKEATPSSNNVPALVFDSTIFDELGGDIFKLDGTSMDGQRFIETVEEDGQSYERAEAALKAVIGQEIVMNVQVEVFSNPALYPNKFSINKVW